MTTSNCPIDVTLIGESLVDVSCKVSDDFLKFFNLVKTDRNDLDAKAFVRLKQALPNLVYKSGGSVANTAYQLAKMGIKTHFLTKVGTDPAGDVFYKDISSVGVSCNPVDDAYQTFELVVLITPDGERTFVASGFPPPISFTKSELHCLEYSRYIVIEGFMLLSHKETVMQTAKMAQKHKKKVIVTLSAPFVADKIKTTFAHLLRLGVDLVIGNRDEVRELKKSFSTDHLDFFNPQTRWLVTHGADDVYYKTATWYIKMQFDVLPNPVDKTGAGDAFAAGFLCHYIANNGSKAAVLDGMELGHKLAGEVIMIEGSRI
jgi:sugar/nucleoside kinase (ribokinase family)